jgi:hypothetical protein
MLTEQLATAGPEALTPLQRLARMVQKAEAEVKGGKLRAALESARVRLATAEAAARAAEAARRSGRPRLEEEGATLAAEEEALRGLVRKVAMLRSRMGPEDLEEADRAIADGRADLETRGAENRRALAGLRQAEEAAQAEARSAEAEYVRLKAELARIDPDNLPDLADADAVLGRLQERTPERRARRLGEAVRASRAYFGDLSRGEQRAQLMVWIGQLRQLQEEVGADAVPGMPWVRDGLEQVFRDLVSLSKEYMPGYIEAFQEGYRADWDLYLASAQAALATALETGQREREAARVVALREEADRSRRVESQELGRALLDQLRALVGADGPPDGATFEDLVRRAIAAVGAGHSELLELVAPHRELLGGADFRALRRKLEGAGWGPAAGTKGPHRDVLPVTTGRVALLIGGSPREENRRQLEEKLGLAQLDWIRYEASRPAAMASLIRRATSGSCQLVLILKEFVGHHVSEQLRPPCEAAGVPCLMVEKGYGLAQVTEAIRRARLDPLPTEAVAEEAGCPG